MKKGAFLKMSIILVAGILVLSGCSLWGKNKSVDKSGKVGQEVSEINNQLAKQSQIKKFKDYEELQTFLEENVASGSTYGYGSMRLDAPLAEEGLKSTDLGLGYAEATGLAGAVEVAPNSVGSSDYSQTNVQVEGVDEADIIKTDGKYIYAVVQNDLYIIDAYPAAEADILTKIAFKSRPQDIYINGDRLIVFGSDQQVRTLDVYRQFKRRNNYAFFKIFDISDHKNPKQLRDLDIEGNYNNSRMIGDYVYFVTNNYNYYYIPEEPMVPRIIDGGAVLPEKCGLGGKCFEPDVYYFDIPYDNYNFTTVTAINVKDNDKDIKGDVYILSGSQNMYVSQNNIYITYTKYISEYELAAQVMKDLVLPRLSAKDKEKIVKIEEVDNFILNRQEKLNKIMVIIQRYSETLTDDERDQLEEELANKMKQTYQDISKELEKTVIHKIAIDKDKLEYKTFGEVTGQVLNQFSMDENNGYFRIATTKNRTWSQYQDETERDSYSNLYVLDEDLKVVGSVENLAEGERIYSVRFMQNRAYLVTFQQTDPLFVIDLADPKNPKVLGKLKVPGFSNYLHPYDDTTLIGIGKDTAESEWGGVRTKGLKLSLFDVSKVDDPKEIANYTMGDAGSDSIALHDHKAFLFSKEKNLLVIPATIYEQGAVDRYGNSKFVFGGAVVFTVDKNGFTLKGKIDHSDGGSPAGHDYWGGYDYYDNTVKRSLYIDSVLYTFSNNYLQMNKLDNLDSVKKLRLKKTKTVVPEPEIDYEVIN